IVRGPGMSYLPEGAPGGGRPAVQRCFSKFNIAVSEVSMSTAAASSLSVTLADVRAARERIAGRVHRTPVLTSRQLDALADCRMFFKCELFQRGGAFKARGAFSRLTLLAPAERAGGVVAFSSGNHAQAVAL